MEKHAAKNLLSFAPAWMCHTPEIFTDDSKLVSYVVQSNKCLSKGYGYDDFRYILGEGLLLSENPKWAIRRKLITPAFHYKVLEEFFEIFKKHNSKFLDEINLRADGEFIDINPVVNDSVIQNLCETAMGCNEFISNDEYINSARFVLKLMLLRHFELKYYIPVVYRFSNLRKEIDKHSNNMRDFTLKVIEKRSDQLKGDIKRGINYEENEYFGIKKKACLLDILLRSTINDKPLTNDDIIEEVNNFMFAGQDTTTNTISFTLFLLAKYPKVQQKLRQEIDNVIGENEVSFAVINEFKYLDMIIKECNRLYPPVPIISRKITEEMEIEGLTFPTGTNFHLLLYRLFKNPKIFENPEEFIPERFEKSEGYGFSFIPFSAVICCF
jgi:cytochrome P450 family 4